MAHLSLTLLLLVLIASGCDRSVAAMDASPLLDTSPEAGTVDVAIEVRPWIRPDVVVEGVDATVPDEGAVVFATGPDCTVARFEGPFDSRPTCSPRRSRPCTCADGRAGAELCLTSSTWGRCACTVVDGGLQRTDEVAAVTEAPLPWIGRPRLLAPQSGSRVTSTRPSLRWLLPAGLSRARVELCADRACARVVQQQEVAEEIWRSGTPLAPGVMFWRVRGLDGSGEVRWTSATWEFAVGRRDRGVDISFGTVKDFNGDGYDDLAVPGARHSPTSAMLVYPGSPTGVDEQRVVELGVPYVRAEYNHFGDSLAVGDYNGDGLADLAVGAPTYRNGPDPYPAGRVFLYLGHRSCVLAPYEGIYRAADDRIIQDYGRQLSSGDFNGDGYADLMVSGSSNAAQLHLGGPRGLVEAPADVSMIAGRSARFVGDLNGDGYGDLIVQHWRVEGAREPPFLVVYGNPEGLVALRGQVVPAWTDADTYAGHQARGADFNEDGYGDVAVSGGGVVAVFYGAAEGLGAATQLERRHLGPASEPRGAFGGELAVGDFDGDGHIELAVSQTTAPAVRDPELRYGPGMLHFYTRAAGMDVLGSTISFSITGSPPGGIGFGHPTAPGDINGDGGDDLAIGAGQVGLMGMSQLWVYHGGVSGWQRSPVSVFTRNYAFQHTK